MEIGEIFKDSFNYPTQDWKKLLTIGVVYLVCVLLIAAGFVSMVIMANETGLALFIIFLILGIVGSIVISGYNLDIVRNTVNNSSEIPELNIKANLIDGIKLAIVSFIYGLIPAIIILIVAVLTLGFGFLNIATNPILNQTLASNSTDAMLSIFAGSLAVPILITALVALILGVLYSLLTYTATARLAETNSMGAALNIPEIIEIIGQIGWAKYIIWLIVLVIISAVVGFISNVLFSLLIGIIIVPLIIYPFLFFLSSRATGLIYNESK
ncbi:MAG: DUF4013 domain-containing protein [Methanobacteriaceae archaeon]